MAKVTEQAEVEVICPLCKEKLVPLGETMYHHKPPWQGRCVVSRWLAASAAIARQTKAQKSKGK